MLEQRKIKLDSLHLDAAKGNPSLIPSGPGQYIPDARLQGRWQPTRRTTTMTPPGSPIAQIGTSATATIARPLAQSLSYLLSAMAQFCQMQRVMDLACGCRFHAGQGHPGRLGARVDFEHSGLHGALLLGAIFQSDGKRHQAMHDRAVFAEKQARSF